VSSCFFFLHICVYFPVKCYINATEYVSRSFYDVRVGNLAGNTAGVPPSMGTSAMDIKPAYLGLRTTPATMDIKTSFSSLHAATRTHCTPSNTSNASGSSSSTTLFTRLPLPQLALEDHPNVQNWFEDSYKGRRKAGRNGVLEGSHGNPKGSILSSFMEDENGHEIPRAEQDNVRATARGFFNLLLQMGRAPPVLRDLAIDARHEYLYIMESSHPFLRLCNNHWKAMRVTTNSYSQWYGGLSIVLLLSRPRMPPLVR